MEVFNRTRKDDFLRSHPNCTYISDFTQTKASIVFSCLSNDSAVEAVFMQWLDQSASAREASSSSTIYLDCSTILPSTAVKLASIASRNNLTYMSCPVFGRPDAAQAGMLLAILAGGTDAQRQRMKPILSSSFAKRGVWDLGDRPEKANTLKLAGNLFIVGSIELAATCMTLCSSADLPERYMVDLMEVFFKAGIPSGYANRLLERKFDSSDGFAVDLALKDVDHMRSLGSTLTCPLPIADTIFQHLLTTKAKFGGDIDWGALILAIRDAAGLTNS